MDRFQNVATSTTRRTIGSYSSYADAQKAVDYLSDNKFSVEKTAIVAEGLRFVEQVTGRLNWGRVIGNGASSGALTGVIIGLFLGLLFPPAPGALLNLVITGLIIGVITGILFAVVGYAVTGGRRDFSSVGGMQAERYNVMADADVADEAERILQGMR